MTTESSYQLVMRRATAIRERNRRERMELEQREAARLAQEAAAADAVEDFGK